MTPFFTDLFDYPFLQMALAAIVLSSVPAGAIGSFVVVRKSTYLAGAMAHGIIGGLGLTHYLRLEHGLDWASPALGAIGATLLFGTIIVYFSHEQQERLDTLLSLIWAAGMAIGVFFFAASPGFGEGLMSYLFGDILLVNLQDLWVLLALNALVLGVVGLCYPQLLALSFQRQLAQLRGMRTLVYEWILVQLTGITIVILMKSVGILLVLALLTLPAATASRFCHRLSSMIAVASLICLLAGFIGLWISYGPGFPAGPTIILVNVAVFLAVSLIRPAR